MAVIELYGGPIKRSLIQRAFGMCGQSVTDFELTPEEYDLGLVAANDVAAQFGGNFPWNAPTYGNGAPEDESGLPQIDVMGFTALLALEIAQNIGKEVRLNGTQARAVSSLRVKYTPTPNMSFGRGTIAGAGNKYRPGYNYLPTEPAPIDDGDPGNLAAIVAGAGS